MRVYQAIAAAFLAGLFGSCQPGQPKPVSHGDSASAPLVHAQTYAQKPLTPYEVLWKLKEGNRSFVAKLTPAHTNNDSSYSYSDQVAHTRDQQHPIACVLTCMDSRVPPEIIFDQGIGSLFVVRVAGNVEDPDVLGSMEYAVAEKGVSVVVVLGHKNCGAVGAAFGKVDPGNKELALLIARIKEDVVVNDRPPYDASSKHHVKKTIDKILNGSNTIQSKLLAGKLIIVGALYDVSNGTIDWHTENW